MIFGDPAICRPSLFNVYRVCDRIRQLKYFGTANDEARQQSMIDELKKQGENEQA